MANSAFTPSGVTSVAANQTQQEAGSSTDVYVSPGRQQFHPSAAKAWGNVTVSGGVPTLNANYNLSSVTDTATGRLTWNIATDFSSANWTMLGVGSPVAGAELNTNSDVNKTAGSVLSECINTSATYADPAVWDMAGFGDQ